MSGMISVQAQSGLEKFFSDSFLEPFHLSADEFEMKTLKNHSEIKEEEFIMLTVSSYTFRIFTLLHFTNDENSKKYVAKALSTSPENLEDNKFYDYLNEVGNTFCGAFKREIGKHFPHTGMSTPNKLLHGCLAHMQDADFECEIHYKLNIKGNMSFCGSMYATAYSEVDFHVPANNQLDDNVDTGALEMF